jgi:hypothetical protein
MKTPIVLALAASLSAGIMAVPAQAQRANHQSALPGVTVIFVKDYYDPSDYNQIPQRYRHASPQTIARAQAEINADSRLRAALQGKRVQLRNVVGVATALNGGKIVYVR